MACKNICKHYKAIDKNSKSARYANGQKRCPTCEIFLICDYNNCPCCRRKLRLKPKNARLKRQYNNILKSKIAKLSPLSLFNQIQIATD
jgi:hypothetical protein